MPFIGARGIALRRVEADGFLCMEVKDGRGTTSPRIHLFLMVVFRLAERRTLAELTAFDFVLLLVIGEAPQQALLGEDFSLFNAFLVILTLIGLEILFSLLKPRSSRFEKWLDGVPMIIVEHGHPLKDLMIKARIDEEDIIAARQKQGLERMDQIKYAILERSGGISIVPKSS